MLTYCTNIHPGESWGETFENVRRHVPVVKAAVAAGRPFPVGLRVSGRAAGEIDGRASRELGAWCREEGCLVTTLNGFPYGPFHGAPVKADVYLPDWRHLERLRYTLSLARLLSDLLPEGGRGSLSTVPVGFRAAMRPEELPVALGHLRAALADLVRLEEQTGRHVSLAVEPEPACVVETSDEVVWLFEALDLDDRLRSHLGVCYDCCHQAVQFEDPADSLARLEAAGICVAQVQVSSALRLRGGDLRPLERFCEPVYLHQTVGRRKDGSVVRFADLPEALAASPEGVEEWRVHFHVPVFLQELAECETTQPFLLDILRRFPSGTPMEVETYTWSVLPPDLQMPEVTDSIIRELRWVGEVLG